MSSGFCSHDEVEVMGVISVSSPNASLSFLVRQGPKAIVSELIVVTSWV